jgi:hypothetical protein
MDLYTLTPFFLPGDPVDKYVSAIWTERYSKAGDCQVVLPATTENVDQLAEGTFLALHGSQEVMLIQTQSIENNLLTVVGTSLTEFLNQRLAWFKNPEYDAGADPAPDPSTRVADLTLDTMKPGEFISHVVDISVINPVAMTGDWADANLTTLADEIITGLAIGEIDDSGDVKRITATIGPLYDSIQQIAEKEKIGIKMYLDSASVDTGYSLLFDTYSGVDRTSDQSTFPLIRLSPNFDTISDLKEVRSIANSKNVAYVYYQGIVTQHIFDTPLGVFCRRVLMTDAQGEPPGRKYTGRYDPGSGWRYGQTLPPGPTEIAAFREQNAKDALANHNYVRSIDGQTSPIDEYKYGIDYGLGDIIELEGLTHLISRARVTEYIRSHDENGAKEYPTISVE